MLNISGLDNGIVLDHIPAGMSMEIYKYLNLGKLDSQVAIIKNASSKKMGNERYHQDCQAGIDSIDLDVIGFLNHKITVNIITNGKISEKKTLIAKETDKCYSLQKPKMYYIHRTGTAECFPSDRSRNSHLQM